MNDLQATLWQALNETKDLTMQDFRETKIKILSEEHSRAFQEAVFEVGGKWHEDGEFHRAHEQHYLYVNKDLVLEWGISTSFFESHDYKEIIFPLPHQTAGHVHAVLMAQYAEDAKTHPEPWKLWQVKCADGAWRDCHDNPTWGRDTEYRRKPKTHIVHGVEIPDLRATPKYGEYYYLVNPLSDCLFTHYRCTGNSSEDLWVERGLSYQSTEEGKQAAILHSKAMLGIK